MNRPAAPGGRLSRCRALVVICCLGLGVFSPGAKAGGVTEWWPLLTGNTRGTFTPVEGRPLAWSAVWADAGAETRRGEVEVTGLDFRLRVSVLLDLRTNRMRWRVEEGRIELASWVPALAGRAEFAMLAGMAATGAVEITGEGGLAAGVPSGQLNLVWQGTLKNEAQDWSIEGVVLRAGGDVDALLKEDVPVELSVKTMATSRFGARNLEVGGVLKNFARVDVAKAQIEIAGGDVSAKPFSVALADPALSVKLAMRRVGLEDLVVFVPATFSEVHGRVNGDLQLDWNSKDGVQVGAGTLVLEKSEPTTVRLTAAPGFLTDSVPVRFTLAPAWLGPLADLFSPANPAYPTLQAIELGKLGLRVETLEARLTPGGDEKGRTASVFIRALPQKPGGAVKSVTFQVNLSGPLAEVLRLGARQNFSLEMK